MNNKEEQKASDSKQEASERICFIIMPFGGWFDQYYENVYSLAIREAGLIPRRADDIYRPGTIVNDIWALTKEATIVLADLTDKNPNVLYELGLAHAIAKPAILIAESIDDIPFDLRALRIIEYNKHAPNWGEILQQNITKAIEEILNSPLRSVLPAFLEVDQDSSNKHVSRHEKELLEIRQELEVLRREVARTQPLYHIEVDHERSLKSVIMEQLDKGYSPSLVAEMLMVSKSYVYQVRNMFSAARAHDAKRREGREDA